MARIVIVGTSQASRSQLFGLLASSGYGIFRCCGGGGELRRALNACEDGVLIILGPPSDCGPEELVEDFGASFQILMIARPEVLSRWAVAEIFTLSYPCAGSVVLGAVEMLCQLHAKRLPKRTGSEKHMIDRAKRVLMDRQGLSEPEAHRRLQRYAMGHNMKLIDYAAKLLEGAEGTEE